MRKLWSNLFIIALVALYIMAVVAYVAVNNDQFQWDFKAYYYAGHAYELGLDPYLHGAVAEAAGEELGYFYAYSPATLPLLRLFTSVDFKTAYFLYLIFKLLALGSLFYLWSVKFMSSEVDPLFFLFCFFGFGGAIYTDLVSGNISLFEQLGLWLAFYALLKHRPTMFCALVILVSLFKLTPILFLVLLIFTKERGRYRYLLVSGVSFLILQGLAYLRHPLFFEHFLNIGWKLDERGSQNPSILALLRDGFEFLEQRNILIPTFLPIAIYLAFCVAIVLVTWFVVKRVKEIERPLMIFLICLAYALIMPRFKDYSYVLLLLPAYYMIWKVIKIPSLYLMVVMLMVASNFPLPFGLSAPISTFIWGYYPLLTTFAIWVLASYAIVKKEKTQTQAVLIQ